MKSTRFVKKIRELELNVVRFRFTFFATPVMENSENFMSISPDDFGYLSDLVRKYTGIDVADSKAYLFESRLQSILRSEGLDSLEELVERLQLEATNSTTLHLKVLDAMTTNETSFFRDVHPFEELKNTLIPHFLKLRANERTLNIWSAACSTGQEPYSIAMLAQEHFPDLMGWSFNIFASDIAESTLARAKTGVYNRIEINRGLPAKYLAKYFVQNGDSWRLKESVQRMVDFRHINLIEPWPALPPIDIVLMRNVLIYFDLDAKKAILGRLQRVLKHDGCLFLGSAETTLNLDSAFVRSGSDKTGYYRLHNNHDKA